MNLGKMMQQAKKMQDDMKTLQIRLAEMTVSGTAAGGAVTVTMACNGAVKDIKLDSSLVVADEKDMLEAAIVAALNSAREKMDETVASETQKIMGGLQLPPGFSLPF